MTEYKDKIRVGVIGGARPESKFRKIAFEVGKLIAVKGAILICGGLSGVMEAAARGVKKAGGLSVGILPGSTPKDANPYIDIAVATGMGYSRNHLPRVGKYCLLTTCIPHRFEAQKILKVSH